ncbi:MAG: SDR family oxidoreductase [Polyangiaceae bacterium]
MNIESYFQGKSVVITGGSSGIGLAIAKQAVRFGAEVHLVARRRSLLEEAKAAIVAATPRASVSVIDVDVSRWDDVDAKMTQHFASRPVDMLVNNAGIAKPGKFLELPLEEFRNQMDVNYFGAVHMCRALIPKMIGSGRGGGHVVNVSSLAGVIGIFGYTAYTPTKFALSGFSQVLRAEMWPHNVRVSVVLPPDTDTPQLAFENQFKPAETKAIAGTVKTLSAEQVAAAILRGMANNDFEIYCDAASRMSAIAQGVVPGVVRFFCDTAQKKVGRTES